MVLAKIKLGARPNTHHPYHYGHDEQLQGQVAYDLKFLFHDPPCG